MRHILLYILLFFSIATYAQLGGSTIYDFVNLPGSARENALGGKIISINDGDVSMALKNPSLADSTYSGEFGGTWGSMHILSSNIGFGSVAYAHTKDKITYIGGVHFLNYGVFDNYDEDETRIGTFFASDYEILFGGSYEIHPKIRVGATIKPILSYYESYSSYGLLQDYAITYNDTSRLFTTSFMLANAGWQLTQYYGDNKEPIPFSVDFGITKKLAHAPLRLSFTYEGLNNFDLSYDKKFEQQNSLINEEDSTAQTTTDLKTFSTSLLNHMHIAGEVMLFKSLHFNIGYNFRRAYEMSFGDSKNGVGMSLGFRLKLSRFSVSYGWSKQFISNGTNFFTFTTNVDDLYNQFKK